MSITSADAVFTLAIPGIFDSPVPLQQFSADDIFTTESVQVAQAVMGVDGIMTGGYTPNPTPQQISLMADSISNALFDQWNDQMVQSRDVFYANAVVILSSVATKWTLTKGVLTAYQRMPNAAKILQPRRYGVTWESVVPTPTDL